MRLKKGRLDGVTIRTQRTKGDTVGCVEEPWRPRPIDETASPSKKWNLPLAECRVTREARRRHGASTSTTTLTTTTSRRRRRPQRQSAADCAPAASSGEEKSRSRAAAASHTNSVPSRCICTLRRPSESCAATPSSIRCHGWAACPTNNPR